MEPRFQHRKDQLLADCQVPPAIFRGVMSRLEAFAQPFAATLPSPESRPTPAPTSPGCSPTSSTRTPSRSPTATTSTARPSSPSSATSLGS